MPYLDQRYPYSWIKKQNADIAFLQETYSTPEIVDEWKFQWHGNIYYSHGTNHSKGVLILASDKLQFELRSVKKKKKNQVSREAQREIPPCRKCFSKLLVGRP